MAARRADSPDLGVSGQSLTLVRHGMTMVVNEPGGTALARIRTAMAMAGKTGSAQVRRISMHERETGVKKNEALPWKERDNALFVAFAPVAAPRYAIGDLRRAWRRRICGGGPDRPRPADRGPARRRRAHLSSDPGKTPTAVPASVQVPDHDDGHDHDHDHGANPEAAHDRQPLASEVRRRRDARAARNSGMSAGHSFC